MKISHELLETGECVHVHGEIVPPHHVVQVVPLDVQWDTSLDRLLHDFLRPAQVFVTESTLMITKRPIGRKMRSPDDARVLLHDGCGVGAQEEVQVEDATDRAKGQGRGRLEDHL